MKDWHEFVKTLQFRVERGRNRSPKPKLNDLGACEKTSLCFAVSRQGIIEVKQFIEAASAAGRDER